MKTKRCELRVIYGVGQKLRRLLAHSASGHHEAVVFAFVGYSTLANALIVRDLVELDEHAFVPSVHGAEWSHRDLVRLAAMAAGAGAGICVLHSHGGAGPPRLSSTDKTSFAEMQASLSALFPTLLFASVVLSGDDHAAGLLRRPDGAIWTVDSARWLGAQIAIRPEPPVLHRARAKRHDVLWGPQGEGRLRNVRIGVIGTGGGGSHALQQLAQAGAGTLVGVDHDLLDEGNRSRTIGTRSSDVGKPKLAAMRRMVRDAGDHVKFIAVEERFPSSKSVVELAKCDILISCLDTFAARKEIMAFAWQHAIPLIDIGLTIESTDPPPGVSAIGGQVFIGIPGYRCMWCDGLISNARLDLEKDEAGYVRGGGAAQVVSLNGALASQAVSEALTLINGLLGSAEPPVSRIIYDGRSFAPVTSARRLPCDCCEHRASGDAVWSSAHSQP